MPVLLTYNWQNTSGVGSAMKNTIYIFHIQLIVIALTPFFVLWKYMGIAPTATLVVVLVPLWSPFFYLLIGEWLPCCTKKAVFLSYAGSLILLIACQNVRGLSSYRLLAFGLFWTLLGFHIGYDVFMYIKRRMQLTLDGTKQE
jgi:hypothetical protein